MTKTVLITGGSSGIGFELSKRFAQDGYRLLLIALEQDELEHAKASLEEAYGVEVLILQKDLSRLEAAQEIYSFAFEKNLPIDVLVNNAGFGSYGFLNETGLEHEQRMLMVNNMAVLSLTKLFLHEMTARNAGKILNIASIAGLQPTPSFAAYGATKQFVHNLSMALNHELRLQHSNITVTVVCPPATRTNFGRRANMANHRVFDDILTMEAEEVAAAAYRAMQNGRARLILPRWSAWVQTGLYRILPLRAIMRMVYWGMREG